MSGSAKCKHYKPVPIIYGVISPPNSCNNKIVRGINGNPMEVDTLREGNEKKSTVQESKSSHKYL